MTYSENPPRYLIVMPSYNTGAILLRTVQAVLQQPVPLWVVMDGSTDNSVALLKPLLTEYSNQLYLIELPHNIGKGAAIFQAAQRAQAQGFTHILTMDADYQHPADAIADFIQHSQQQPRAMILGQPIFAASAPALRVQGRKISNAWANLETLGWGIGDSLFGMRVYPLPDFIAVMRGCRWAQRFDFEPEIAVRLAWRGVPAVNLPTPVRYLTSAEGGISQFHYGRDNLLLTWMHTRLFVGFLIRLPFLLLRSIFHYDYPL